MHHAEKSTSQSCKLSTKLPALCARLNPTIDPFSLPTIDISFGTRSALGVQEVCDAGSNCTGETDGMCSFYPEEPIVTITIK